MRLTNVLVLGLGLFLFAGCSQKHPGAQIDEPVWPYEFYKRFNLRTIISSYSNQLKFVCASYPREFYLPGGVVMPNSDKVVIEDKDRYLSFDLVSTDQVIIEDVLKDGKYHAKHLYTFYYNEEHDDFRADTFYIPIHPKCVPLILKEDENVSDAKPEDKKS